MSWFEQVPLKRVATINDHVLSESTPPEFEFRYLDIGGVQRGVLVDQPSSVIFSEAPSRARRVVRDGDTIVSTVRTHLGAIWNVPGSAEDWIVSTGFAVVRPRTINPRYLAWALQSQQFIERVAAYSNGVSYPAISPSDLANLEIWWPPNGLQTAIADYLDVETARIDALIEKKQRLIELLHDQVEARRSSLIASNTRAGRIRWRWPRRRNKEFVRESHRRSVTGEETMLSVSHLTGVTPRSEKTVYMFEAESTVGYKLVEPGDLVINTMWAWMGAAGTSKVRGIVSPAYGVYSIDRCKVEPDWVDLVVRSRPYIIEMTRYSRGVTSSRLRLYPAEFLALFMPIPPIDEQRRITRRFTVAVENRRRAQRALTRQIELLGERRQALITAAVTGEFTVPGVP